MANSGHCAYCDGYPIGAQSRKEVDHFKPRTAYPALVCTWSNLYLCCTACNSAKLDEWNRHLLRSDERSYDFARYFIVDSLTGELQANPDATPAEMRRAGESIRVLNLNRPELCISRRRAIRHPDPSPLNERAYRFLF